MNANGKNTPLTKNEIEKMQDNLDVLEADVGSLSDDLYAVHLEVFNSGFMRKYTLQYESFTDFIEDSPSTLDPEAFQKIDKFVRENTVFDDWDEMKQKAIEEWIASNI